MRGPIADFLKQSLAISVGGPLAGLLVVIAVRPGLLVLAAFTFTLPFMVLGAWFVGSVPAFFTSVVLYFARSRLGRLSTVLVTAVAAAGFGAAWTLVIFHDAHGQSIRFAAVVAALSAASSLTFSVPKWDAR
jgi:hypothetical protein